MGNHKISSLFLVCAAGAAIFFGLSGARGFSAPATGTPEVMRSFPADCQFVFGVDVQRIVASPSYRQLKQLVVGKQAPSFETKRRSVVEAVGLDYERDIDHVYGAGCGAPDEDAGDGGALAVVSGRLDRKAITDAILRRPRLTEKERGGHRIFTVTIGEGDAALKKSVVFLSDRELAVGDLAALENLLDVRERKKPGLLTDPKMAALLPTVDYGAMAWFAGDAAMAIRNSPLKSPLEQPGLNAANSIESVTGTLDFAEAFRLNVSATAVDAVAAEQLTGAAQVLLDIVRAGAAETPQMKTLLAGFDMSRQGERITLSLDCPLDVIEQLVK
ncbi:MAG: hypothetical protein LBT74_10595 [Acidobacteriota bacterium]|jgi:hypothetical protein|nr:hypothetical protein [Acidobacteriota bacterium]